MSNSANLLRGKKVLVIGGSSGIGRSVAAAALSNGASIVIASSSQERVDLAVEQLKQVSNTSVKGESFDIQDFNALKSFLSREGPFDHLAITAGRLGLNNFPNEEVDEAAKIQNTAQHIYKNQLINAGGSIVLTSGTGVVRPQPGWTMMIGPGGAIESSTRGLAIDVKPIRVNTIAPGLVDTEHFDKLPDEIRKGAFKVHQEKLLVGHVGNADEVAEAYIFAMKSSTIHSIGQRCELIPFKMNLGFEGVHVLVTGASGGIGFSITKLFLEHGARVTAQYNTKPGPLDDAKMSSDRLHVVQSDVRHEEAVKDLFLAAGEAWRQEAQVLILNHGVFTSEDIDLVDMDLSQWNQCLSVNLTGSFLVARQFLRHLRNPRAGYEPDLAKVAIVIIGSTSDYAATKFALQTGFLSTLKHEIVKIAPNGRVNSVAPGWADSGGLSLFDHND
ncbi:unnamed protein product [Rhizoctonia solani]|uniref:NAD(P)-binding protein n=1 Tax=Rhizoctonia solani TaxID=456999 RepID=A0A8H3CA97_9AGAM|nr:unnamed protein product [Rhizoctonia solani]